jgi:hypothetical protein
MVMGFQTCLKKKLLHMSTHLRIIHPGGGEDFSLPFYVLYAASCDMFRFLIWFIVAYLVSVFHSKCLVRVFDVMHQKIKPHLVVKPDLLAWI